MHFVREMDSSLILSAESCLKYKSEMPHQKQDDADKM
jgi:hypothetical protein